MKCSICGHNTFAAAVTIYDTNYCVDKIGCKICSKCFEFWSAGNQDALLNRIKLKITGEHDESK